MFLKVVTLLTVRDCMGMLPTQKLRMEEACHPSEESLLMMMMMMVKVMVMIGGGCARSRAHAPACVWVCAHEGSRYL